MKILSLTTVLCFIALASSQATPNYTSPLGVQVYNPSQLFNVSGPWSLMTKAGPTLYISGTRTITPPPPPQTKSRTLLNHPKGMRGFYPSNTTLAPIGLPRVQQAFANMKQLAELGGSSLVGQILALTTYSLADASS